MDCNHCNKVVPYIAHEADMARQERTIKRMWSIIVILIAVLVLTNVGWIVYESQFETTTTTEMQDVQQEITADGTAIVAGIGDAIYGDESQTDG